MASAPGGEQNFSIEKMLYHNIESILLSVLWLYYILPAPRPELRLSRRGGLDGSNELSPPQIYPVKKAQFTSIFIDIYSNIDLCLY